MVGEGRDDLEFGLARGDRQEIVRSASETLARQSSSSVYGHWVLASVVLLTASFCRSHAVVGAAAAAWVAALGGARLAIARSFPAGSPLRLRRWKNLFRAGLALSSATWGLGGAFLLTESAFSSDSRLVLLSIAGIAAAGIASTAADILVLRLHVLLLLLPTWVAGMLFMPGSRRLVLGYGVVVGCYAAFLWVQGGHAHASLIATLVKTKLLERRTIELEAARLESLRRNRDMRLVLDSMAQGLVTIDKDGALGEERSRVIDAWFGVPPAGMNVAELFRGIRPEVAASLRLGLGQVFENALPLELALAQLPARIEDGQRAYELAYEPVDEASGIPTKLLLMISDVTDRVHAERSEAEQREQMSLFGAATRDRSGLAEFVRETGELLAFIGEHVARDARQPEVLRALHTVKGNAGLIGLTRLAALCHEIEFRIADGGMLARDDNDVLQTTWSLLAQRVEGLLGGVPSGIDVTTFDLAELASAIDHGKPREELLRIMSRWSMEPVEKRLARMGAQARRLADSLGKPDIVIETNAEGVRLPRERFAPFWNALVHVVRNAVDHGIEPAPERLAAGKLASGRLTLSARQGRDQIVVEVTDDGRGIDWKRLREKAQAAHLPVSSPGDLVDALFVDGVTTRDEATEISGRGIGLGAVRAACDGLGGRLEVQSATGQGTTLRFVFSQRDEAFRGGGALPWPAEAVRVAGSH
jgi:two-component system chemotaxis sensor kinase CheA